MSKLQISTVTFPCFTASNLKDVLDLIRSNQCNLSDDHTTLVVFDVDGVILRASPFRQYFLESLVAEDTTQSNKNLLSSVIEKIENTKTRFKNERQFNGQRDLQDLITFLDTGQESIISICLTHLGSGNSQFYHDQSLIKTEDWRIDNIRPYNNYFAKQHMRLCGTSESIEFSTPLYPQNSKVLFKNGILFIGDENISFNKAENGCVINKAEKGYVLMKFLEHTQYLPKKVIFIDDVLDNLHSVAAVCKILKIEYCGIHHQREYKPKFLSQEFVDHCIGFATTGIMANDDSDTEWEENMSKSVIDQTFYDTVQALDVTLSGVITPQIETVI